MLSQGSSFSFNGSSWNATSVVVEGPTAEIVNATSNAAAVGAMVMVPTGDYSSPASVSVEAIGFANPLSFVTAIGNLTFSTPGGSVSKKAICESASVEGRVGELLRIRFRFILTDY